MKETSVIPRQISVVILSKRSYDACHSAPGAIADGAAPVCDEESLW
jgi:hypothetical protein